MMPSNKKRGRRIVTIRNNAARAGANDYKSIFSAQ